jgi:hypothetical protein
MALRPRPSLHIPEARRAEDITVIRIDDREGHGSPGVPPGQGGVDVACGLNLPLRDWTPLIKRGLFRRGRYQAVDVAVVKGFETNVPSPQHRTVGSHGSSMQGIRATVEERPFEGRVRNE